jgi:hypothetical protein
LARSYDHFSELQKRNRAAFIPSFFRAEAMTLFKQWRIVGREVSEQLYRSEAVFGNLPGITTIFDSFSEVFPAIRQAERKST